MSVLRQQNWLGQQRVDIPHLRAIESSICADFDALAGKIMAGGAAVIVSGFDTITAGAVGQPASALQVNTANALVMHVNATDSGTIFQVPSTRAVETLNAVNTRVKGGFTSSSTNYVGIDLVRSADSTTSDLVQFINPVSNLESPKDVPLGRTLDYVIYISTQDFSTTPGICPIAIITTDSSNNVTAITDARNLFFRLGNGGSNPNAKGSYSWPGGRTELGTNADFSAGDKAIKSQHDWMDAIMSRIWEIGGGEYWYSNAAWHNVQLVRTGTSVFVSTGDYFEWTGTNLHWKSLRFVFSNSTGSYNDIQDQTTDSAGLTDLADGQCIYVDLDRTQNRVAGTNALVAVKGTTATLGSPLIPGSRAIIAWRSGANIYTRGNSYYVGAGFAVATTSAVGTVKLYSTPGTPATPVVFNPDANGTLNVTSTGVNAPGIVATGNGSGIVAQGTGTYFGISATGGATGSGVNGVGGATSGNGVVGNGGTNGNGVVGVGNGTGSGVDATGGSSGVGIVTHAVSSNDNAQFKTVDTGGNVRFAIDHLGYPSGRRQEIRENWQAPTPASPSTGTQTAVWSGYSPWYYTLTNNTLAGFGNTTPAGGGGVPSSDWPGMGVVLLSTLATNNQSVVYSNRAWFLPKTYTSASLEFDVATGGGPGQNATCLVGFVDQGGAGNIGTPSNFVGIGFRSTDTTWQANVGGTYTDTGVTITTATWYSIRIEWHGSATQYGSKVRFFINGVLKLEVTVGIPAFGNGCSFMLGAYSTGTIGSQVNFAVSPVYCTYNRGSLSLPVV